MSRSRATAANSGPYASLGPEISGVARAAIRRVTSWSSDEKNRSLSRARSAGHCSSQSPKCGLMEAWIPRIPESMSARMAASECSAVRELCEKSSMHVMPQSRAVSAAKCVPTYMSSGPYTGATVASVETT